LQQESQLNHLLLAFQILGQISWGIICFLEAPNNFILLGVNLTLAGATALSSITGDKKEYLFFTVYFALWIIPAFFLIYSSLSGLFDTLYSALQNAGVSSPSRLDNSLSMSVNMLKDYFIYMLIAPAFRLISLLFRV
jgi:hypothetical protein